MSILRQDASDRSTITIPDLDLLNPGQYFACCGLFELAHRKWGDKTRARFGCVEVKNRSPIPDGTFTLDIPQPGLDAEKLKKELIDPLHIEGVAPNDPVAPVYLSDGSPFPFLINWWLAGASYKTWAGQQKSFGILNDLLTEAKKAVDIVAGFALPVNMSGRLSLDTRSNWTGLHAGFSPNDQKLKVATFPMIEFLGAVGLQRFLPGRRRIPNKDAKYDYTIWFLPLNLQNASVASKTIPENTISNEFRIMKSGNYKYFTRAINGEIS